MQLYIKDLENQSYIWWISHTNGNTKFPSVETSVAKEYAKEEEKKKEEKNTTTLAIYHGELLATPYE